MGRIAIGWGTCVGLTISGSFETSVLQLRRQNICGEGGDLCCELRNHFGQKRNQFPVGLCCRFDICQRHCVVLLHFRKQRRVGLCGFHIGRISFGFQNPGESSCLFKCSCKLSFKINENFVESLFTGPLPEIILIETTFFDVHERHRNNLGRRIKILTRDRFLVPCYFWINNQVTTI